MNRRYNQPWGHNNEPNRSNNQVKTCDLPRIMSRFCLHLWKLARTLTRCIMGRASSPPWPTKIAENFRSLPKSVEDFPTTSKDNQRCRRFSRISNQSQAPFRRCSGDFSNVFKQLHSLGSVRREKLVWIHEMTILDPPAWDSLLMR